MGAWGPAVVGIRDSGSAILETVVVDFVGLAEEQA